MTRERVLSLLRQLYACGNRADARASAIDHGEDWTKPRMAGLAFCAHIDRALHAMRECAAITEDGLIAFHDL